MSTLREPWDYEDPACAEVGTALFYAPDPEDMFKGARWEDPYVYAKKVCGTCVHKLECAEWGMENEEHGVWGGLSPRDRKRLRAGNPIKMTRKSLPFSVKR